MEKQVHKELRHVQEKKCYRNIEEKATYSDQAAGARLHEGAYILVGVFLVSA